MFSSIFVVGVGTHSLVGRMSFGFSYRSMPFRMYNMYSYAARMKFSWNTAEFQFQIECEKFDIWRVLVIVYL